MTVFKGYMRIMKKNKGLILLYLGIFFGVTMALQAAAGKETYTSYESEKIKIGVVDKDNGPLDVYKRQLVIYAMVQAADMMKCVIGFILVKKGVWLQNIVS